MARASAGGRGGTTGGPGVGTRAGLAELQRLATRGPEAAAANRRAARREARAARG